MASDEGYIMVASDWRGMSDIDRPVIAKALASDLNVLRAVGDNIIQGYANKAAIQHFSRHKLMGLLDITLGENVVQVHNEGINYIFYGVSQGGILGGGYSALVGESDLLDGTVLVSAASPFSVIMSRSTIFPLYHHLMLLNLHHSRFVRITLSMIQMVYDSIEVTGILATPLQQKYPKTLIQTGLGDTIVSMYGTGKNFIKSNHISVKQ